MKFRIITLLMAVIALYACEDEDLQHVSFEQNLITVDAEAQSISVLVKADCPWFLSSDTDRAYATTTYGESNDIVEIVVYRNATFEQGNYTFTLTSENGQERATLLIVQDARIKMEYSTDDCVPAEGGNFNIYMSTNDNVRCTDTPEWVTHVSGRAVESHTFVLECKDNRTGLPRHASIVFTGKKDEYVINIKQDSYTPEKVDVKIPSSLVEGLIPYKYTVSMTPVYADWSKLQPEISGGATARIEKESVILEFPRFGTYTLSIYSMGNLLYKQDITVHPTEAVLNVSDKTSVCLGQAIDLTDDNCSLRFDNPSLVQFQADGTHKFIREGQLQITSINDYSNDKVSATVDIERVVLNIESFRTNSGANADHVSILFSATGYDIAQYQFYLTDNQTGHALDFQDGVGVGTGMQTLYYRTANESVPVTVDDPVRYVLDKYTLHLVTTIAGDSYHFKKKF